MARKITFETEIDSRGVRVGLERVESLAKESQRRMALTKKTAGLLPTIDPATGTVSGSSGGGAGGMAGPGGKRGNFSQSSSMFVSVARDSAASLASGAPITQVIAQQAPQVLQAFTMMGLAIKTLLSYVLPLAALGGAALLVWMHFKKIAEQIKNLKALTDTSNYTFSENIKALKDSAKAAQDHQDWINSLSDAQRRMAEKTDEATEALKAQHKVQREIAERRGASPKQLAQLELNQARIELAALQKAKAEAQASFNQNKAAAAEAEKSASDPTRGRQITKLGQMSDFASKVVDAAQAQLKNTPTISEMIPTAGIGGLPYARQRATNESDLMSFTVDGKDFSMSVKEARAAFDKVSKEETELVAKQHELKNLLDEKKKLTEEDNAKVGRLSAEINTLENSIGSQRKLLPTAGMKGGVGSISSDSLTSVGNFLGAGRGAVSSIAERQLEAQNKSVTEAVKANATLVRILDKLGISSSGLSLEVPGT